MSEQKESQQQQPEEQVATGANKSEYNETQYQNRNINDTYKAGNTSSPHNGLTNRSMIALIVYLALLLDNVLLTVIVPILPDYLATINNRTLRPTTLAAVAAAAAAATTPGAGPLHYTPLGSMAAANGLNASNGDGGGSGVGVGLALLGSTSTAQHMAYRNVDGTAQQQHVMTKHPIPGKSMVNFSLIHLVSDDNNNNNNNKNRYNKNNYNNNKLLISLPINEEQPNENKGGQQQYLANTLGSSDKISDQQQQQRIQKHLTLHSSSVPPSATDELLASENGSIGVLLAMKALVQLIFNPIVGNLSIRYGYRLPIVMGTFCLLLSSLVFAVGETYATLLIARAVQGIGSASIGVCGMSLVAQHYPEEERRSKVMGIILGSIALGVLLGYPFGGILYDLFGKSAPFIILSTIIFVNLGMQLVTMDLSIQPEVINVMDVVTADVEHQNPKWMPLLRSKMIIAIAIAIWFSTSTLSILEPCLPIWLMQYIKPNKWQLGTVFIPDSVGYFVGTNFFGTIAYKYGQIKISCLCLLLVGISSIMIPNATTVSQLLMPHFGLGLGVGIIDAALVPLLATFVDATLSQQEHADVEGKTINNGNSMSSYGSVYAIQQTSVSLAYCLAPLIGGELAQAVGFVWLMRIVGIFNIIYGPVLVYLYYKYDPMVLREKQHEMLLSSSGGSYGAGGSKYRQLYNSVDRE